MEPIKFSVPKCQDDWSGCDYQHLIACVSTISWWTAKSLECTQGDVAEASFKIFHAAMDFERDILICS